MWRALQMQPRHILSLHFPTIGMPSQRQPLHLQIPMRARRSTDSASMLSRRYRSESILMQVSASVFGHKSYDSSAASEANSGEVQGDS